MTWSQLNSQMSPRRRQDLSRGKVSHKADRWAMFSCGIENGVTFLRYRPFSILLRKT